MSIQAPISVVIDSVVQSIITASPIRACVVVPHEAGVTAAVNTLTKVQNSNYVSLLGATTYARRWYDYLISKGEHEFVVLPFTPGNSITEAQTNMSTALDALLSLSQLSLAGGPPDLLLIPDYPSRATGVYGGLTKAEDVCVNPLVRAVCISDTYWSSTGASQAEVETWANANSHEAVMGIGNKIHASTQEEWGSVIVAGHYIAAAAREDIWAHPFDFDHPVNGVHSPDPVRVFALNSGNAEVNILAERPYCVTSFFERDGREYAWKGLLNTVADHDPREHLSNAIVTNRVARDVEKLLEVLPNKRIDGLLLRDSRNTMEDALEARYVPDGLRAVSVDTPTHLGGAVSANILVHHYDYIDSVALTVTVTH